MEIETLARAKLKVRLIDSDSIVETVISYQNRDQDIYYCWNITDANGNFIAGKCLPISKRLIPTNDVLSFVINNSKSSINNYKVGRRKLFEVIETHKL